MLILGPGDCLLVRSESEEAAFDGKGKNKTFHTLSDATKAQVAIEAPASEIPAPLSGAKSPLF